MANDKLTPKQEKFCVEYLVDLNATQAAIRAGYSEKTAYSQGQRLLKDVEIENRIRELRDRYFTQTIASAAEVEAFLSASMRGEVEEEVVVVEGSGEGYSEARIVKKQVSARDRIKAAELMGKRHQLFTEKVKVDSIVPVVIKGEDDLET